MRVSKQVRRTLAAHHEHQRGLAVLPSMLAPYAVRSLDHDLLDLLPQNTGAL